MVFSAQASALVLRPLGLPAPLWDSGFARTGGDGRWRIIWKVCVVSDGKWPNHCLLLSIVQNSSIT